MNTIAVVGLGAMGKPIARNLLTAGHEVTVWNRGPQPVADLVAAGARPARNVSEAFASGVVFSVLADDRSVTDVFLDPGLLSGAPEGAVHVNLATVSTGLARHAAHLHARHGVGYVAAPVFGRVPVAEAGLLNVLAAGDPALIDRVQPFLDVIGVRTWRLGDRPEQANIVKILGNYLIASAVQSLGEAISLAEHTGVDASTLVELLTSTLFPGTVYSGYGELIASRSYEPAGFTTSLGLKDVNLALDAAEQARLVLPVGDVLRTVLTETIAAGRAEQDWASIAELQRARTDDAGS
ncbi:NAD(P)-dependent oxidoreductase [Streptosporangium lutulentum]|uniref:3-hydroxyisobutyrate dehydrogenase-like beta-hydroxyacid dehydrogenase n=1 Tax=Streptosporangium lutulentum TaxID=1461250 RepID=A0ABT9QH25_9ACTN|nr:NAD(P)-dependent oxidoreductase [Streptosporangium lutulentum]MDP9845992.1 3-hydroxyisobutyrate dehydrogenase-like beta-hydroxyacid dehydrogenase [Streptosporangium lutulentum]